MDLNQTVLYVEIDPCYRLDMYSFTVSFNPSVMCISQHFFFGLLSFMTVSGNLLVIISVIYFREFHSPTNFLILSLAVADLLVGIVVIPLSRTFSAGFCAINKDPFCKACDWFEITLSTSSILTLCCISIDRYYAVCHPLIYQAKITNNVVLIMVVVIWVLSASIGISLTVLITLYPEHCNDKCFALGNLIGNILVFFAPAFIMLCVYFKIFLVALKQARSLQKSGVSKRERKATKTLAIVMGVFLLCWLPFFIVKNFSYFNPHLYILMPLNNFNVFDWFALLNSLLNPFIYAYFYSWFRSAFRLIISGKIFMGDFANAKLQ